MNQEQWYQKQWYNGWSTFRPNAIPWRKEEIEIEIDEFAYPHGKSIGIQETQKLTESFLKSTLSQN